MLIRRYKGRSLTELHEAVERDLGEEAVIAHVEKKRSGKNLFSFLGGMEYNVVAVREDGASTISSKNSDNNDAEQQSLYQEQKRQYKGVRRSIRMVDEKLVDIGTDISRLKEGIYNFVPRKPATPRLGTTQPDAGMRSFAMLAADNNNKGMTDAGKAGAKTIRVVPGLDFKQKNGFPDVYLFAGPTGVGKTTTLAKLAADCVISRRLNVGIITMDTYRIGGVEQLRQYADLLGVSLKVAFSPTELKNHIDRFADKDVVFLDTPGRSQFNYSGIVNIQDMLSKYGTPNSLLIVPANIREDDAESIVAGYGQLNPQSLIITKTDEATACDGISVLCSLAEVPVSYITDGQRVPEDIKTASSAYIQKFASSNSESSETIKEKQDEQWY